MTHILNCYFTQATLLGNLSGQELKTMVSTSELQKTKGTVRTHTLILTVLAVNLSICTII